VRDARGLRYLAYLLRHPHQQIHVLDLAASTADLQEEDWTGSAGERNKMALAELGVRVSRLGDAGAILDPQARAAYKRRLEELRDEIEEAQALDDTARADHIEQERDFLIQEIASAVGLGGRERRAAAPAERARVNVTRAIKAALEKLATYHPVLRHHLKATIYTGLFCSYTPDLDRLSCWQF